MIDFQCPHCDVKISAEAEYAGATANCPSCGGDLIVPPDSSQPIAPYLHKPVAPSKMGELPPVPGAHNEPATKSISVNQLTSLLPKKLVIAGCIILGLVLVFSFSGGSPRSGKVDSESEFRDVAQRNQNIMRENDGKACRVCGGSGSKSKAKCSSCYGQGTVRTPSGYVMVCSSCQGSGWVPEACSACGGTGVFHSPY